MGTKNAPMSNRVPLTRRWGIPLVAAFALHVVLALALARALPPAAPLTERPEAIEVVFAPPEPETPQTFTEQPEDRVPEENDDPRLLSNVTTRARDAAPDGDDESPQLSGPSDVVAVEIEGGDPAPPAAEPIETSEAEAEPPPPGDTELDVPPDPDARPDDASREPSAPRAEASNTVPRPRSVPQLALHSPGTNTPLSGAVTLSTLEWAYADWMKAFREHFVPRWRPPSGYRWALIHGHTTLDVRIGRGGEVLSLAVVERNGHQALHDASARAFERADPLPPLPDDFPEEALEMRIQLGYPKVWR